MVSPTSNTSWPALSEHRWLRLTVFTAFYLCQGFPIGLIQVAFPAWLLAQGVGSTEVSRFVAITTMPWALKLLSGPFMDRLAFPAMGLRRPWVLLAQTMLAGSGLMLLGFSDPHAHLAGLTVVCMLMNTWAAIQDVAVDGMAITVLRDDERGRANAFMVAGQVTGYSFTGWLSVVLLNKYGIPATGFLTAAAVGSVGALALAFRERPGERVLPWTKGAPHPDAPAPERNTLHLLRQTFRLLILPMSLVLVGVEVSYRVLEGVALVWHPDMAIKSLGYSDSDYSRWASITSALAAALGLLMGPVVDRIGARRGIALGLVSNAVLYAVLWTTIPVLAHPAYAVSMLAGAQLGSQWMFISTVSLFMKICGIRVAATQFAIYMALSNLARSGGARIYPSLVEWFGANGIYLFMTAIYLVAIAILSRFNLVRHQRRLAELGEG